MVGTPPRCPTKCGAHQQPGFKGFGGPDWKGRSPNVPELTAEDNREIAAAIAARRARLTVAARAETPERLEQDDAFDRPKINGNGHAKNGTHR